MRKNEIKICILFAILAAFLACCFLYNSAVSRLKNDANAVAEKRREFVRLSQNISEAFLDFRKSKNQLLQKPPDIRGSILEGLKKINAKKASIKILEDSEEICGMHHIALQFEAKSERGIYNFSRSLRSKFNIIFDTIKMSRNQSDSLKIEMKFRCIKFKKIDEAIRIEPKKRYGANGANGAKKEARAIKRINIFSKDKAPKHILKGIINGSKAFIDDEWKKLGEFVGDSEIVGISDNFITIETDDMRRKIRVGDFL